MAKITYKGLIPPDDPIFKEGWKVFSVKSAESPIENQVDLLKKVEMSWINLHSLFYSNLIKSILKKELEEEVGGELVSENYSCLDDDDKMLLAIGCMNVLVAHSPTIAVVDFFNGRAVDPAINIKGFENCVFIEFFGKFYGVFDSEKEAYACIETKIFPYLC